MIDINSFVDQCLTKPVIAPLAGITDRPFRKILRQLGARLMFTEMVSTEGLIRQSKRSFEYLRIDGEPTTGIQLFGSNPVAVERSVELVLAAVNPICLDFNCGCPVKKVVRQGAGAALMKEPDRLLEILAAARRVIPITIPFGVKVRLGFSPPEVITDLIERIADQGVDYITIHGRFASAGYSGPADWEPIYRAAARVKIPVLGNGDIFTAADYHRLVKPPLTGGMLARGIIRNPFLFAEIVNPSEEESEESSEEVRRQSCRHNWINKLEIMKRHLGYNIEEYGPGKGLRSFRSRFLGYTHSMPGGVEFRRRAVLINQPDELLELIEKLLEHCCATVIS